MKKFSFSLQKLLNYREQLFEIEQNLLINMRTVLNEMIDELERLKQEHVERSNLFNEKMKIGATAQEVEMHKVYMRMIDYNAEQKEIQIQMQKEIIDKQADKVREAKIEISIMEKLKEKKLEEYRYLETKANDLFIEEFVSNAKSKEL